MTAANPTNGDVQGVSKALETAAKSGVMDESQFMQMLGLLMKKEARLAEKEAALESSLQVRDAQRKHESESYTISKIENQKNCKHLKGGKSRTRGQQRDPNVYMHIFTDGKRVIKCNGCGARWLPGDTGEYLTRNNNKIPNWTKIGWHEAQGLVEDSSNKTSSSEIFPSGYTDQVTRVERKELTIIPNFQI